MEPPTDAPNPTPQTATAGQGSTEPAPVAQAAPADQAGNPPGDPAPPDGRASRPPAPVPPPPRNMLLYTVFGFLCIAVSLWLVFSWTGYKDRYSAQTEGWRLGSTRMLEVTLIREDKKNLACASDRIFDGIHCGYRASQTPWGPGPDQDGNTLQPFNTVKNELFLAAGLWQAPILQGELPSSRFTVVCNYHVKGVLKSVSLRWSPTGSFSPVDQSVTVGTVTDCVIPQ
jgi:hypothetical protein